MIKKKLYTFLFEGGIKDLGIIDFFFSFYWFFWHILDATEMEGKRSDRLLLCQLFYLQKRCHSLDRLKQELAVMEDSKKCPILKRCPSDQRVWQHPLLKVRVTVKATEGAVSFSVSPMTVNITTLSLFFSFVFCLKTKVTYNIYQLLINLWRWVFHLPEFVMLHMNAREASCSCTL